jgi:hypothetical protein
MAKLGFQIDRKKIDLASSIKNVGKYKAVIKLYENSQAEIQLTIIGQEIKTETHEAPPARPPRRRREEPAAEKLAEGEAPAPAPAETPADGQA